MTDRDINLQRVMNAFASGKNRKIRLGSDRAIDDRRQLYEVEEEYNDRYSQILGARWKTSGRCRPPEGKPSWKRKKELSALIALYYEKRGWTPAGDPTVATLEASVCGVSEEETRARLSAEPTTSTGLTPFAFSGKKRLRLTISSTGNRGAVPHPFSSQPPYTFWKK